LVENGDVLELDGERAAVINRREIKRTFIDETGFEEINSETVKERKQLAYDGTIALVIAIDGTTGELKTKPQIVMRGVQGLDSGNGSLLEAQQIVAAAIAGASRETLSDKTLLKEHVRLELKRYIQKLTGAKPVILPMILQF